MIGLTQQGSQYLFGTLYNKKTDTQGEFLRYEELTEKRREYGQIINNLIAMQGRYTIKTNWNLDYAVNKFIVAKDGSRYQIADVTKMQQEINPQTLYWFNKNLNTEWVLSLVEIDNTMGLK